MGAIKRLKAESSLCHALARRGQSRLPLAPIKPYIREQQCQSTSLPAEGRLGTLQAAEHANGGGPNGGGGPGTPRSRGGRQGPIHARSLASKPAAMLRNPMAGVLGPSARKGVHSRGPGHPGGGTAKALGTLNVAARGRGRIGRGLSEAAEALLGMGGEKAEDEALVGAVSCKVMLQRLGRSSNWEAGVLIKLTGWKRCACH